MRAEVGVNEAPLRNNHGELVAAVVFQITLELVASGLARTVADPVAGDAVGATTTL